MSTQVVDAGRRHTVPAEYLGAAVDYRCLPTVAAVA
jgi:hypothetical protein